MAFFLLVARAAFLASGVALVFEREPVPLWIFLIIAGIAVLNVGAAFLEERRGPLLDRGRILTRVGCTTILIPALIMGFSCARHPDESASERARTVLGITLILLGLTSALVPKRPEPNAERTPES